MSVSIDSIYLFKINNSNKIFMYVYLSLFQHQEVYVDGSMGYFFALKSLELLIKFVDIITYFYYRKDKRVH